MKFVTVRDFRNKSSEIWKQLSQEAEIIVTSNGKPIGLLTSLSGENLEEVVRLSRRVRAGAAVASLQMKSGLSGRSTLSMAEINGEISRSRKARKG